MIEVKKYLSQKIEKNASLVIACSGGPDSMCLLHLLLQEKNEKNLTIICAHVNHKMRVESEEEAKFVKKYCEANDIIYEYFEITDYNEDNFHNQARNKRYEFFRELINKYKAKYLLTAHHGDDLIETILMRIVRGSNLKGYVGFKKEVDYKNYQLLRPLISVTKEDILQYNKTYNIEFATDASNEKDKYTRNRYRHMVLPFLKSEDKDVHKKFNKFSEELNKVDEFLTHYMSNLLTTVIKDDNLDISLFKNLDEFSQHKVLEKMVEIIQEHSLFSIEDKHIELMLEVINSEKSNLVMELPNGFIAEKSYNIFRIIEKQEFENYCIKLTAKTKINNGYILIEDKTDDNSNFVTRLNSCEFKLPLYVRNRKEGDKLEIKNLNGSKKVKDVFIDSKLPLQKRQIYPIVVDSNDTILWIPGLKKTKFDKSINEKYDIILKYEEEKDEYKK